MVSADARARPIAHRAVFEAQIPTEVLRQDQSRSAVHHEGCAGKAALPIPRRAVDRSQDSRRQRQNCRSAATALEGVSRGRREILRSPPHLPRVTPPCANASERQQPDRLVLEERRSTTLVSRRSSRARGPRWRGSARALLLASSASSVASHVSLLPFCYPITWDGVAQVGKTGRLRPRISPKNFG